MKTQAKIDYTQFRNKPFRFLLFVAGQKKWFAIGAITSVSFAGTLTGMMHFVVGKIVDLLNNFDGNINHIYFLVGLLIIIIFLSNSFWRLSSIFMSGWVTHMEKFSTQLSLNYLIEHSAKYFSNQLSGKLQNKIFNISRAIVSVFPIIIWGFLSLLIRLIITTTLAFIAHPVIGIIFIVAIFLSLIYSSLVSKKNALYSEKQALASSETRGLVVDIISNILAVKQSVAQRNERNQTNKSLLKLKKAHLKSWHYGIRVVFINNVINILMFAIIMFVVIHLWQNGTVTVGIVVMFISMFILLYQSLEFISENISRFMIDYGRLKEGLEGIFVPYEVKDDKKSKKVKIEKGNIKLNKVTFRYEEDKDTAVFDNISLNIPSGQKVGIVGESGAGKSTFVSLLLRFMDVEKGEISIDGHNVQKIRQDDLRRSIAYVPQEALLFHRTLKENIKYSAPSATKEELIKATKRAHAFDFINSFPRKFNALVGERGIKLSGGQKQRVMIARAMLKKSPILVFDEATSSLDSKAEKLIQKAMDDLMEGRTTIIVAHRLSTLRKMDRIIVFDGGKVVEDGNHDQLIAQRGKYFELWQHQTGIK